MDLRDLFSGLLSTPFQTLPAVGRVMWHSLLANWWVIILGTMIFVVVGRVIKKWRTPTTPLTRTDTRKGEKERAKRSLLASVLSSCNTVIFSAFVAAQLGIILSKATTGAVFGLAGLASALVAQRFFLDLYSGWQIVNEDRFGIGDYVDYGLGFAGTVTHIGMHSTRLRGHDGTIFHVRHAAFDRVGNRTQSYGSLLVDVTLTPDGERMPTPDEVDQWTDIMVKAAIDLRRTLRAAREVIASKTPTSAPLSNVTAILPTLVPTASETTMVDIGKIDDEAIDRIEMVTSALRKAPAGVTPVFRDVEALGLWDSTRTSVTLRLRVRLVEQSSRSYAMALLRRCLFDAFSELDVATSFADVPEGEVIN